MRKMMTAALASASLAFAAPAMAQQNQQRGSNSPAVNYLSQVPADQQPDVVLDVPNLSVEQITLEVENLRANVSLDARLANLLKLTAGADASIEQVSLDIKGVQAELALIVRLDNVRAIIEQTLKTLENNPEIIETLGSTLDSTVGTVGDVTNNTVGTVGNVATNALGAAGDLTQGLLSQGSTLNLAQSGLSVVSETVNNAGETVRRVRDSSGGLYEVVTDSSNRILRSSRVSR